MHVMGSPGGGVSHSAPGRECPGHSGRSVSRFPSVSSRRGEVASMGDSEAVSMDAVKPILFCIHGLMGNAGQFDQLSSISDRYVIDAWAVPGYAGAPAAPEGASLEWFASRAAEAITATGAAPVHVLGAGWGAMVAMQLVV